MKGFFLSLVVATIFSTTLTQKAQARCEENFIPPHSEEELLAVQNWAVGAAFNMYSRFTNFKWDQKAYVNDNPNQALFNFGLVTATTCLPMDVLQLFVSADYHFSNVLRKAKQSDDKKEAFKAFKTFNKIFLSLAETYGMDRYLIPKGELL